MSRAIVHQQLHGYRKGHQLLSASLTLDPEDQDAVDRLSDLTGPLRPGETFEPYLTAYPLPSTEHYVLARTFQDLKAPRSGCVVTKSVIVPMKVWVALESLEGFLALLMAVEVDEEVETLEVPMNWGKLPNKVSDPRVVELVQALFFENEQPVVVFGAPEADLIATRLLAALWPGLRRRFSICTLALGPRRLDHREFDLVFAPTTGRSRFAGHTYRRIGVGGSARSETEHRGASSVAAQIFESDHPGLAANDLLGILAEDELGDRAAVRIVVLWNELTSRASTTPPAVLGMLDILNSRGNLGDQAWARLLPTIVSAMDLATVRLTLEESWKFLFALEAKVERRTVPKALAHKMEATARRLARGDPHEALKVMEALGMGLESSVAVMRGIGDGIAESDAFAESFLSLRRLAPNVLLKIVNVSDCLGEAIIRMMNNRPNRWIGTLVHALEADDAYSRRKARQRLLPLINDGILKETAPHLLKGVSGVELADLAVRMGNRNGFRTNEVSQTMEKAARHAGSVEVVRDAVMSRVQVSAAERFLLATLTISRSDVEWLLNVNDSAKASRLLTALSARAQDAALRSTLSRGELARRFVTLLRADMPSSALQIARVLMLDLMEDAEGLDVAFEIMPTLPRDEKAVLKSWTLRKALLTALPSDARVAKAVAEFGIRLAAKDLVETATASWIPTSRVSKNLAILNSAPPIIRDGVVGVAEELSRRLVNQRHEDLGEAAYQAWAAMLRDALDGDQQERIRAAGPAFSFALSHVMYPVSQLIVATFPTVYQELPKLKDVDEIGTAVLLHSSYFWQDWKKPKKIRRQLVDALVRAFMRSSWPPADLFVAAMNAGIEDKVAERVRARFRGGRYLESISRDAHRLDKQQRRRILKCIAGSA